MFPLKRACATAGRGTGRLRLAGDRDLCVGRRLRRWRRGLAKLPGGWAGVCGDGRIDDAEVGIGVHLHAAAQAAQFLVDSGNLRPQTLDFRAGVVLFLIEVGPNDFSRWRRGRGGLLRRLGTGRRQGAGGAGGLRRDGVQFVIDVR